MDESAPRYVQPQTSSLAITSLVLGCISFFCSIIAGIPAVILGIISLVRINNSQGRLSGSGLAIGGIATGAISSLMVLPIMVALLLPAIQAAREAARRNQSLNNMKQVSIALQNHHDTKKSFPAAGTGAGLSWRVHLLPFLEEGDVLYKQFHLDEPWDSDHNRTLISLMPDVYRNPNRNIPDGKTNYLAVIGPGTAFDDGKQGISLSTFSDGSSRTIMFVEADDDQAVEWTRPNDLTYTPNSTIPGVGSFRRGGFLAAFGDTHTEFVHDDLCRQEIQAMMTRNAGD